MGVMDDILASDAALFCDPDTMPGGETILYTPKGSTTPLTINANVFRHGPQQVGGVSQAYAPSIEIYIPNNATTGVTSVNIGGDKVTLPERKGETAKTYNVQEILEQDGGMWKLRIS